MIVPFTHSETQGCAASAEPAERQRFLGAPARLPRGKWLEVAHVDANPRMNINPTPSGVRTVTMAMAVIVTGESI